MSRERAKAARAADEKLRRMLPVVSNDNLTKITIPLEVVAADIPEPAEGPADPREFELWAISDLAPAESYCHFAARALTLIADDIGLDLIYEMMMADGPVEAKAMLREWLRQTARDALAGHVLGGTSDDDCDGHLQDWGKF